MKYLFEIGDLAHQQGNVPTSLQAYQAILFSKASLSVYRNIPQEDSRLAMDRLRKINTEWIGPKIPEKYPKRLWSLGTGIFLLGWIFSIFFFIQTGFEKDGKIKKPVAYFPLGLFIITFLLWLLAMKNL